MPFLKTDAPALKNIDNWINSASIDLEEGTHLLYFWNYSCSCCRDRVKLFQRIHQKYSEIKVVGVHTPQFSFEQNEKNLMEAVERLGINHSVAHDSQGEVSKDYETAWAVVVEEGSIVHQQTHRETEDLLDNVSKVLETDKEVDPSDLDQGMASQEFFGYSRTSGLNQEGNHPGEKEYQMPENRKKGETYLKGKWKQTEHYIEAGKDSELRFNFKSSEISLVIDPNDGLRDIEVLVNGEPVSEENAGEDLRVENGKSYIRVKNPDLYSLCGSESQVSEVTLIPDKKTRLYALSFR